MAISVHSSNKLFEKKQSEKYSGILTPINFSPIGTQLVTIIYGFVSAS